MGRSKARKYEYGDTLAEQALMAYLMARRTKGYLSNHVSMKEPTE
jgi:hypothetical protein